MGVDVGGTFTDLVAYRGGEVRRAKVLTRPRKPEEGVVEAIEAAGIKPSEISILVHATTLGTNIFFGQTGLELPEAVLVANEGLEDVIEIGRQNRPSLYDLFFEKPRPLVPRDRRIGVPIRHDYRGVVVREPSGEELGELKRRLAALCSERTVYIISLVHCYANPAAEEEVARLAREACPEAAAVVTSCSVDPQPGEFERTSTAVVNALLRPVLSAYVSRLLGELRARGFQGRLLLMQSSGGLAEHSVVLERPELFIESGPAAGAVAAAWLARRRGDELVVGFDMGGTTAKAVLVRGGEPAVAPMFEVGGRFHMGRRVRGSGYPVRAPYVDLVEVSAGGGTVVWVDPGGALRVGPMSVGAEPGPASYGRGGDKPTITDAHVLLNRIPVEELAGGRLRLARGEAERVYSRLAEQLGVDAWEAAAEALRVANSIMARAVRIVTVERGVNPAETVMYAYGGAGPLHAAEMAEELGISRVVVPPLPGVYSALGLVVAPRRVDAYKPVARLVGETSDSEIDALAAEAAAEAQGKLGAAPSRVEVTVELAYRGQAEAIEVPWTGSLGEALESFRVEYRRLYGYNPPPPEPPVEVRRVHAKAVAAGVDVELEPPLGPCTGPPWSVRAYFLRGGWAEARVVERGCLGEGSVVEGPALILDYDSTIVVPPAWTARVGGDASLLLTSNRSA